MSSAALPVWERIFDFLQNDLIAKKKFTTLQKRGCQQQAIIIALWEDPTNPYPSRYLIDRPILTNWPKIYFKKDDAFPRFDNPNRSDSPKIYMSPAGLIEMVLKLRTACATIKKSPSEPPLHIGCVLWKHPEARQGPVPEFLEMQRLFPECIRPS